MEPAVRAILKGIRTVMYIRRTETSSNRHGGELLFDFRETARPHLQSISGVEKSMQVRSDLLQQSFRTTSSPWATRHDEGPSPERDSSRMEELEARLL